MGASWRTVRTLYAGMGSAALCSAVIGAFYLLAFYTVKRVGSEVAQRHQQQRAVAAAGGTTSRRGAQTTGSQLADGTTQRPPLNVEGTHPLVASLAGISASIVASVFEAPSEWRRHSAAFKEGWLANFGRVGWQTVLWRASQRRGMCT